MDSTTEAPSFPPAKEKSTLLTKVQALGQWWAQSRPARALARYLGANGQLLSSGMALTALLALTATLTLLATLLIGVLGADETLLVAVEERLDSLIPSLLVTSTDPQGLIDLRALSLSHALSLTGVISLAVMAWTTIGVVGQLGNSIRAMFGEGTSQRPWYRQLLRNFLGTLALGVTLILGAVLGVATDLAMDAILQALSLSPSALSRVLLQLGAAVLSLFAAGLAAWILIAGVAGMRASKKDLVQGLALFSLISLALRIAGTSIIGAAHDPLLATAATLIVIVAWLTLQVRVLLLSCAWIANPQE